MPCVGAGFSLVEVLVSFALLGLTASAVFALLIRSSLNTLEGRRVDELVSMARSSLADADRGTIGEHVWCPAAAMWRDGCEGETPKFRRRVIASPVSIEGLPGESAAVEEILVEVSALQAGRAVGERTIRLVTFRAR